MKRILKKDINLGEKIKYLWTYYWKVTVAVLVVLFLGAYFAFTLLNRNEYVFNIAVVSEEFSYNDIEPLDEAIQTVFSDILTEKQSVGISIANDEFSIERFIAEWTAGEYDIILLEKEYYDILKEYGTFSEFKLNPMMTEFSDMVLAEDLQMLNSIDKVKDLVMVTPENRGQTEYLDEFFASQLLTIDFE